MFASRWGLVGALVLGRAPNAIGIPDISNFTGLPGPEAVNANDVKDVSNLLRRHHVPAAMIPIRQIGQCDAEAVGVSMRAHALDLFALSGSHGDGRSSRRSAVEALRFQRSKLVAESSHRKEGGARNGSKGLVAYQEQVFQWFADLPGLLQPEHKKWLADAYIIKEWMQSYKKLVLELGAVFIPIRWQTVTWGCPNLTECTEWRRNLVTAWQQLDHSRLHFVVLMQSNLLQLEGALRANSLPMINMTNVVVFDSRGRDTIPAFPIPLLHYDTIKASEAERTISVAFRGACNDGVSRIRHTLSDIFADFAGSRVTKCGAEWSWNFGDELRSTVFALAPPGSYVTSFRQFEAI
mmetsp:Transcript_101695/g.328109  ORF Transcript_101695/g.328109 Transcript_101695/m.328109 type:complete len:351 (-) Transcript_101695:843-1895(-)